MATDSGLLNPKGIMTFYPTWDEFKNFSRYIAYIESQGAHRAGLAKIVPPKDWKPRRSYDDIDDLVIPAPIQQVVTGQSGLFTQYNIQKKAMTVREFRKTANSDRFCSPHYDDFEELERKYWKNVTFNPPIYGADVNGSLYDPDVMEWNVGHLNTILDTVEHDSGITIEGVNTPYLYFGMWKTTFAWHTEDMDLYSINYLHFGEPKSWYCIPPEHGKRLERLAKGFFPGSSQNCEAFLRHKMTLISPSILRKYGIPFDKITQEAGEFMITFPYGYHAGFNHGFNCAESTNFATQRWIEYGKQAILCSCRKDMVKISMDVFVRKFQPERYKLWLEGKDTVPIDHSKPTPEAAEFLGSEGTRAASQDLHTEDQTTTSPKKSVSKQRIGTKRHRVCLEVPEEVLLKNQTPQEEDECRKKTHLKLPAEQRKAYSTGTCDSKGSVRSADLFHQHTTKELSGQAACPSHCLSVVPRPVSKPGVASLLFHRTLSPTEALQVHSYAARAAPLKTQETRQNNGHTLCDESEVDPDIRSVMKLNIKAETITRQEEQESSTESSDSDEEIDPVKSEDRMERTKVTSKRHLLNSLPLQHPMSTDSASDNGVSASQQTFTGCCAAKTRVYNVVSKPQVLKTQTLQQQQEEEEEEEEEEEIGHQGDDWEQHFSHLWQDLPHDFSAERVYNMRMSQKPPYCAICMLFRTYGQSELLDDGGGSTSSSVAVQNRPRSRPLIPEMCFNSDGSSEEHLSTPHLQADGTSSLVTCSLCCVRVHTSCYGVSQGTPLNEWKCARCEAKALKQDCCLCVLRGGALQRTTNNKWVHVLCVVAILEARFVNVAERSPVDLSDIPSQRYKLKCFHCRKRMPKITGCCVQCSHGRCSTAYHPTCAQAAGVLMHPDDWPFVVHVTCHRHKGAINQERNKAAMRDLQQGQHVICKHKNSRYYQAEVAELTKATFYEVIFDDGSFSDNLFPQDIENRDCVQLGPPQAGEAVQVRWTDGLLYGAKFVAAHVIPMYLVEFEDGSQLSAKREDVYSLDEDLPKRVKSRLSVASDMRFKGVFVEEDVSQDTKRQRVINSRYREDYIEPDLYRAIME
ncbi:lysine-specific demethylase 4A isoform X1 [Denticeps clupeoides]|uniref:lysine-specific demethylase 4A isoform X1 n=1 Tax=Denticeps clupeoides TaxID=299321 RepID=UPI0010A4C8E0|nr:lysine-specific demethylase 4A-like isoform X1 [Denticeps clupeoides]